ncbi:MAG: hypothetical protein U5M50_03980 [Sphingobium sp.]|nr:hypothetical protein [Sphingobium sp.]
MANKPTYYAQADIAIDGKHFAMGDKITGVAADQIALSITNKRVAITPPGEAEPDPEIEADPEEVASPDADKGSKAAGNGNKAG